MMTRRQLQELAMTAGAMLAFLSYAFSSAALIRWFWGAPLIALGAVLLAVGMEKRAADRKMHKELR